MLCLLMGLCIWRNIFLLRSFEKGMFPPLFPPSPKFQVYIWEVRSITNPPPPDVLRIRVPVVVYNPYSPAPSVCRSTCIHQQPPGRMGRGRKHERGVV